MIKYEVYTADWAIKRTKRYRYDTEGYPVVEPSKKHIDDRTIRSKFFPSLEEAEKYIEEIVHRSTPFDHKWLACVEIRKHIIETVKVVK